MSNLRINPHEYCQFGDKRVYILMAITRSKDNGNMVEDGPPTIRKILENEDEIDDKIEQLRTACGRFDCRYRLYLSVNARNSLRALYELQKQIDEWTYKIQLGDENVSKMYKRIDHKWKSILQTNQCRDDKRFLFDFDEKSEIEVDEAISTLEGSTQILVKIDTPNGWHVITEPFNYTELELDIDYELKMDDLMFLGWL